MGIVLLSTEYHIASDLTGFCSVWAVKIGKKFKVVMKAST